MGEAGTFLYFRPWYRRSPYFEETQKAGCRSYELYNHMYLPGYYTSFEDEYWHLVQHVCLWDVAVERCVEITGPDAHRFTNLLTCRDLDRCAVGQAKYAPIIAPDGGILNDPVLLRLGENHYWLSLADSDALLYAKGVQAFAGLDVEVTEADAWPVQVQGPRSRDVMRALFGERVDGIRYYWTLQTDLDGIPVVISRTGWTGELGYEIYLREYDRGPELWNRILEAGAPFGIRPTGPSDIRRMEAGIFNWGADMDWRNNPFEVTGMERLVEEQEADYIGKAALERIRREGVSRKLVGIEIGEERMPEEMTEFWDVTKHGERVGHVTNAVWSPRLRKNIGYAWVPIGLAAHGTELEVHWPFDGPARAVVVPLPFYDPAKAIPKG
ncbi:MAG TPA: glycine cleavage T C-terminal barrel domain-containing protein [Actinomycetota bacterium]|nr:glycine cleavage T C-terminal barrel domain-containing protein [Actinomycetota bacterium]